jgi:ABC-type dipeptide/oligopeptide/nickel transport system permease subunit
LLIIPGIFANQIAPHDYRIGHLDLVKRPPTWIGDKIVDQTVVQTVDRRVARQGEIALRPAELRIDRGTATFLEGGVYGTVDIGDKVRVIIRPRGNWSYVLGTDKQGRDILSRIIHGSRVSLTVSVLAIALGGSMGVALGSVAAYRGGGESW